MKKLFSILIVLVVAVGLVGCNTTEPNNDANTQSTSTAITLKQYNQIENGMTLEAVTDIFKGNGKLISETGEEADVGYTAVYKWWGEADESSAQLTFINGVLATKAEQGLK